MAKPKWWIWYLLDPIKHYFSQNSLQRIGWWLLAGGLVIEVLAVTLMCGDPAFIGNSFAARLGVVAAGGTMAVTGLVLLLTWLYKDSA